LRDHHPAGLGVAHLHEAGWQRPYLVATPEVEAEYREHGIEPTEEGPDCVLLTFDTTLTYEKLRRAAHLIREGRPYLATHPDRVCPTPEGPIPDCGSFIALLEAATGAVPLVLGKPQPSMAGTIRERLERPPTEIAFVGDRLYTDVRMANEHGFLAVLTLTGETVRADLEGSEHVPDLVVESLTELHEHLERSGVVGAGPRPSH
jgi:HAD superfamily hydrolase (TIGR01450 family)